MTSLTGETQQTLKGTVDPPPFWLAMIGAGLQLGVFSYTWTRHTSAGTLMSSSSSTLSMDLAQDPWAQSIVGTLALAAGTAVLSMLHRSPHGGPDPSLVDRMWSILPALYCVLFAAQDSARSPRLLIMTALVTAWACRLSYNFYIKGGYNGGEDYRWKAVRSWFPGWRFELFNVVFICFFQLLLILAFTAPAATALQAGAGVPLGPLDGVAAGSFVLLLTGEAVADAQQFKFQTEKYRRLGAKEKLGPDYEDGFVSTGLWGLSRHPNYFCEVHIWWAFYLFSVATTGRWLNWSIWGVVFLTLLFLPPGGSIDVTESLSSRKYPKFSEYQKRVSRFYPWWPAAGGGSNKKNDKKKV